MTENINHKDASEMEEVLRNFVIENFLPSAGLDAFKNDDSFMEKGIIDSTGILELLEFIEETFSIRVEDKEVIPDNLDSLNKLKSFIKMKTGHAG